MKKLLSLLMAALLALGRAGEASPVLPVCESFPSVAYVTPEGEERTLSAVPGEKPLFLVLFATWCPDCAAFLPQLDAFVREREDITVLALSVSADDTPRILSSYREAHALTLPMGCAEAGTAGLLRIEWIPTLIVLDASGTLLGRWEEELTDPEMFPRLAEQFPRAEN